MRLNIINLPERIDRRISADHQMQEQGITDYEYWDGIKDPFMSFRGICKAHKQIVSHAKQNGLSSVCIAEDDIIFTAPNAWSYFLDNTPEDFDIYLGMIYQGTLVNNRVADFWCGMTLYMVHERFYDRFLSIRETNNIDRELSKMRGSFRFMVCDPFVCEQMDGYSDNKKKEATYGHLLEGRRVLGR
jgi:hypothetical protein